VSSKYYRIAMQQMPIGYIFGPTGIFPLGTEARELEECLERNRPACCLQRDGCVYMREDRDFSRMGLSYAEGYVHVVEPIGPVQQRDVTWIGHLQLLLNPSADIRALSEAQRMRRHGLTNDELAQKYWQGSGSPAPHWEHVTSSAKVVEVDSFQSLTKP